MKKLLFIIGVLFFVNNIFAQKTEQELLKTSEFFLKNRLNNPKSYVREYYSVTKHYLYDSLVEQLSIKEETKINLTEELGDFNNKKQLNQTQKVEWLRLTNEKIDLNNNEINSLRDSIVYYKNLIDSCDKSLSLLSDKIKRKEKLSSFGIYTTYTAVFIGGFFMPTGITLMTSISTPLLTIHTSVSDYGKNAFLGKKYKSLKDEYYSVIGLKNSYDENIKSCEYHITELNKEITELNKEINKVKEGSIGYVETQEMLANLSKISSRHIYIPDELWVEINTYISYYEVKDKKLNKYISSHTNRIEELTKEIESLKIRISNTNKKQVRRYDVNIIFHATNKYGGIVKCHYHISYDSFGYIIEDWSDDKTGVFY